MLKQILGDDFFVIEEGTGTDDVQSNEKQNVDKSNEKTDNEQSCVKMEEKLKKIEEEKNKLQSENDLLEKKLKKNEALKVEKDKKIKEKELKRVNNENEKLMKKIKELQNIKVQFDELQRDYEDYKKKTEYFEKLKNLKKVLLIDMKPMKSGEFPYQYHELNLNIKNYKLPKGEFTEVWMMKNKYDSLYLSEIYQNIEKEYGTIDYLFFDEESLNKMGLEKIK